jgi:hypothetical protein
VLVTLRTQSHENLQLRESSSLNFAESLWFVKYINPLIRD